MRVGIGILAAGVAVVAGMTTVTTASAQVAPSFTAEIAATGTYDSNVARGDAQVAAREHLTPQDGIFSPTLTVDLVRPIGAAALTVHGLFGYNFYDRNTILNSASIDLNAGLRGRVGPCKGDLKGEYDQQQSNLEDVTAGVVRNVLKTQSIVFDGSCPREIGFGPTVSLSETAGNNSNPIQNPNDYDTFKGAAGVAYTRPNFGELSLFGEYVRTQLPKSLVPVGTGQERNGYQVYSGGIRYDRRLGARIQGIFSITYTSLEPDIAGESKFAGPTYSADITFRVTGKIKAYLHADQALEPATQLNTTYSVTQNYFAEATYQPSSRLMLKLGVSSRIDDNKGTILVNPLDLTHDTIGSIYGSVSLNVGRRLVLVLDLRQEDRTAKPAIYNYDDTRVSFTARAKF